MGVKNSASSVASSPGWDDQKMFGFKLAQSPSNKKIRSESTHNLLSYVEYKLANKETETIA